MTWVIIMSLVFVGFVIVFDHVNQRFEVFFDGHSELGGWWLDGAGVSAGWEGASCVASVPVVGRHGAENYESVARPQQGFTSLTLLVPNYISTVLVYDSERWEGKVNLKSRSRLRKVRLWAEGMLWRL